MAFNDKGTKPKVLIGVILLIFLIFIVVIVVFGVKGILKIIATAVGVALILALVGMVVWVVWFIFFRKERYDVTYVTKKKLIEAGKLNLAKNILGDLYLSGDAGHSRVRIGKIIGYCRIQVLKRTNKYFEEGEKKGKMMYEESVNPDDEKIPVYDLDSEEQDVFCVKKGLGIIAEPLVIRVSPQDHDNLVGDVTLKGFSLIPHSEYWFINKDFLDVRKIDFAILKEAERGIMFENLRDMKTIVDKSIGLDSEHKKNIEQKNLVEIPQSQGGAR